MLGEQMAIHTMGLNPATRALATASGRGIGSLKRARLPRNTLGEHRNKPGIVLAPLRVA